MRRKLSTNHADVAGENNPNWKGGVKMLRGYRYIKVKDHPFVSKSGYMAEHRLVVEKHLNRYLIKSEVIHHINGIKDDNRIENLQLLKDQGEHNRIEGKNGTYVKYKNFECKCGDKRHYGKGKCHKCWSKEWSREHRRKNGTRIREYNKDWRKRKKYEKS